MIEYKKGNLIDALLQGEVGYIGHQANCFCTMNSGIAKEIKARIPSAYELDQATSKGSKEKLGTYSYVDGVFNIYSQYYYGYSGGRFTDYTALDSALRAMRNCIDERQMLGVSNAIGFPRIGCGLGGGDWSVVAPMIEKIFKGYKVVVYDL